jgi:release factor glutamine methyltransferase
MISSEISSQACVLAMRNAQRILKDSASRLTLCPIQDSRDVCQSLLKQGVKADFLISNPPYLLSSAEEVEEEVLHNEPHEALFGPSERPSYYYEQMAQFGRDLLTSEGVMFLELPHERSQDIVRMLHDQGWETSVFQDLTKRDRVCLAQWRGEKN